MNGTGLFEKVKLATDEYNNKVKQEKTEISKETNTIDEYVSINSYRSGAYTGSTQYGTFWFPAKENAKGFNTFSSSSRMINARVVEQSNVKALLLEKGIEYKISCNIRTYCASGHGFEFGLYDVKNKKFVLSKKENYTSSGVWRNLRADYTYTPEEDLRVIYAYDMTNGSGYSYVGRGIVSFNTNEQNTKFIDEIKYNDATINGSVYPTIKSSNNVLEKTSTTSVKLLANKTYKITYKYVLDLPNATWGKLRLWNFTTNSAIDTYEWTNQYSNTEYTIIYPTTTDTQIGLYINRDGGTSDGRVVDGTKIIVEELN